MKRFSILCCLVLLLNVLCPVGHVHAEKIATPTDTCTHEHIVYRAKEEGHYPYCPDCDTAFEDQLTPHDEYVLMYDDDSHWWECPKCSIVKDYTQYTHEASCANPGVCATCGYKDENMHVVHGEDGYWADGNECVYGCTICKKESWRKKHLTSDDDSHWVDCSNCGYKAESEAHTYVPKFDEYYHWEECTVCGHCKGNGSHAASCTTPGVCKICGYEGDNITSYHDEYGYWADGNACVHGCLICKEEDWRGNHYHLNDDSNGHWFDCYNCGYKTEPETHTYVFESDENLHWEECTVCGNIRNENNHKASCANPGVCEICGYEKEGLSAHHGKYGCWADGDECVYGCLDCKKESWRDSHCGSCINKNVCRYCGHEGDCDGYDHDYDYDSRVSDGESGHHCVCKDCGDIDRESHFTWCGDQPGVCSVCGYESENIEITHWNLIVSDGKAGHHYECFDCGKETEIEAHRVSCLNPGVCLECDYEDATLTADHNFGHWADDADCVYGCLDCKEEFERNEHMATCTSPDRCVYCGKDLGVVYGPDEVAHYFDDAVSMGAEGHRITCRECGRIEVLNHWADCLTPTHCYGCDYVGEISDIQHTFYGVYTGSDDTQHWYTCLECKEVIKKDHTWGDPVIVEATATTDGSKTYTCADCGETKVEVIPATGNEATDTPTVRPTVEPTVEPEATATPDNEPAEPAHVHTYGACVPTGSGSHTQTCTVCGNTIASSCTMVDTTIGNLDASACIYCGYITWKLDNAANGKQESKAVENATFQMVDENGAAVDTSSLTLVVYESAPEATIQLDTGASLAIKKALTVTVLEGGAPMKLANTVKLSIPMADDLTGLKLLVVDENGELLEIAYEVIDGVMTFETDILGIFMLVEEI